MENQGQVWERSTTLQLILKTPHILLRMVEFTVRWRTTWDYKEFHGILVCLAFSRHYFRGLLIVMYHMHYLFQNSSIKK